MKLWNWILTDVGFRHTESVEGCLVDLLEHVDHLRTLEVHISLFLDDWGLCLVSLVSFSDFREGLWRNLILDRNKGVRFSCVVSLDLLGRVDSLHVGTIRSFFPLLGSVFSRCEELLSGLQLLRFLFLLLFLLSFLQVFLGIFFCLLAEIFNLNLL